MTNKSSKMNCKISQSGKNSSKPLKTKSVMGKNSKNKKNLKNSPKIIKKSTKNTDYLDITKKNDKN